MFHPFNAHVATTHTKEARAIREAEDAILLQSYLTIAHVYIQRSVSCGNNRAYVYCPYNLRNQFAEALHKSGFTVEASKQNTSFFLVKWEEE